MKLATLTLIIVILLSAGCGGGDAPTAVPNTVVAPNPAGAAATMPPAVATPAPPAATAAPTPAPPTGTTAPAPTATPESLIIAFPTPTPEPTTTPAPPAPTATPVPTPRPGGTALDPDICHRTPEVQEIILDLLNVPLCTMVSPRELFRIREIEMSGILHPDDLAGFDNLLALHYEGALDFVDLSHTPSLRDLRLSEMAEWPQGFTLDGLPLQRLRIEMRGEASCQIFQRGTIERIFGGLIGQWQGIGVRLDIRLPDGIVPEDESSNVAAVALAEALRLDVDALVEVRLVNNYGDDWREEMESWDPDDRDRRLAEYRISAILNIVDINRDRSGDYRCQ